MEITPVQTWVIDQKTGNIWVKPAAREALGKLINEHENFTQCSTLLKHTDGEAGETGSGVVTEENTAMLPVLPNFV